VRPRHVLIVLVVALCAAPTIWLALLLLSQLSDRASGPGGGPPEPIRQHSQLDTIVVRVVDGDTLVARVGDRAERVRLIGVDTPETVSPSKPVQCYGKQASDHLKSLLPEGTAVRLQTDADTHDVYGRLLAYVYRRADGMFVNLELARDGYASLLTFPPNVAHEPQFSAAVDRAHRQRLGLWGTCGGPGVALADTPTTPPRDGGSGR